MQRGPLPSSCHLETNIPNLRTPLVQVHVTAPSDLAAPLPGLCQVHRLGQGARKLPCACRARAGAQAVSEHGKKLKPSAVLEQLGWRWLRASGLETAVLRHAKEARRRIREVWSTFEAGDRQLCTKRDSAIEGAGMLNRTER